MSYRVAVLVSGEGTNLQAILESVHGRGGIEVVCVGSSRPGVPALARAVAAGVPTGAFAAGDYPDRVARDRALADWIDAYSADLVVLAGFMELLSSTFVRRFEGRILNVHPSLLPAFPGLHAIEQAVASGVKVTGVTVHFVDEGVDTGPIVLQEAFPLPYPRDIGAIEERMHGVEHRLLPKAIRLIAEGAVRVDPDDPRQVLVSEDHARH